MIVIADTSPIRYLALLGHADLLPKLYGVVIVPTAVLAEMRAIGSPVVVKEFCDDIPDWLEVKPLSKPVSRDLLAVLDLGESEAIQLAMEINADLMLIDERRGRNVAASLGLDLHRNPRRPANCSRERLD